MPPPRVVDCELVATMHVRTLSTLMILVAVCCALENHCPTLRLFLLSA